MPDPNFDLQAAKQSAPLTLHAEPEAKPWYVSKTLWLNLLSAAALVLSLISENAGGFGIPAEVLPYLALLLALVNVGLRFLTGQPLSVHADRA